jgi:hypothetical protein
MTTQPARRPAAYTVGQAVEVLATDFTVPGFPRVWTAGTVTKVEAFNAKLWDVMVRDEAGHFYPQVVGSRGGNPNIRPVR